MDYHEDDDIFMESKLYPWLDDPSCEEDIYDDPDYGYDDPEDDEDDPDFDYVDNDEF